MPGQKNRAKSAQASENASEVDSGFVEGTEQSGGTDQYSDAPSAESTRSRRRRKRGPKGRRGAGLQQVQESRDESEQTPAVLRRSGQDPAKGLEKPAGPTAPVLSGKPGTTATGTRFQGDKKAVQGQQKEDGGKKGGHSLKLRLDLNLELELELKAVIKGDLTLSLLE
ncbi:MAG: hypothetical protein M1837_001879 [Sclerophora amabilis]|nr:MAG: hypothetical protein M1837_001879 [Sclerophora amabilis]